MGTQLEEDINKHSHLRALKNTRAHIVTAINQVNIALETMPNTIGGSNRYLLHDAAEALRATEHDLLAQIKWNFPGDKS